MRKLKDFFMLTKSNFVKQGATKQNTILLILFALILPLSCLIDSFFEGNILLDLNFFLVFIPCSAVVHFNQKIFLDNPVRFRNFIIVGFSINLIITLIIWGCF